MKVTFLNKPKLSEHEVDQDFNERRGKLIPLMEEFLIKHPLFVDKDISVTFLHAGVSSLVSVIETSEQKLVLKIPLSRLNSRLEGAFLEAWENVGVKVPHVLEEGEIGEHFYVLMEYIDSETISSKYTGKESLEKNVYHDLGELLRKMHKAKTEGYSNIVNKKSEPEYFSITEWLKGDTSMQTQVAYVKEHKLLDDEKHGSIDDVFKILISNIGDSKESVYCHNDFGGGNVFATEPLTVFDPWPCFHHPFMDIARSLIVSSKENIAEVSNQFLNGYFGDEHYDKNLLHAFLILNIVVKLPYMHKTKGIERIKNLQKYLEETKDLLV
ncbi:aminoglycoside phosphotransferase family protein [Candidatus Woesebacteria bacterium]|jgi:fructosamine-3-kinase|nr:aminoglycoside phosphotransferase family protein [Candidatus Woesebacteria bacterium]